MQTQTDDLVSPETRTIDGIPINNIWFLMFYASDMLKHLGKNKIALEAPPDNLFDLVGRVFLLKVERRLKMGVKSQYVDQSAIINRVRGRINFIESERKNLPLQGKVKCQFSELSVDTPRNRYIRQTLDLLSKRVDDPGLIKRAKVCIRLLKQKGVVGRAPSTKDISGEHLGRMDRDDKGVLDAAYLIHDIQMLSEDVGRQSLLKPEQSSPYIKQLFTRAMIGFYQYSLMNTGWIVDAEAAFNWGEEPVSESSLTPLENIRCDLALHHAARGESYLIDTKFRSLLTDEGTVNEADLYPLYTLLSTQHKNGMLKKKARGLIIRPAVSDVIEERLLIKGCEIRLCTIDLRASAVDIRHQLLSQVIFQ